MGFTSRKFDIEAFYESDHVRIANRIRRHVFDEIVPYFKEKGYSGTHILARPFTLDSKKKHPMYKLPTQVFIFRKGTGVGTRLEIKHRA